GRPIRVNLYLVLVPIFPKRGRWKNVDNGGYRHGCRRHARFGAAGLWMKRRIVAAPHGARSMHWLIDGYNLIRRDPALASREAESLEAGRIALCRVLAQAARGSGDRFTVVFDGRG